MSENIPVTSAPQGLAQANGRSINAVFIAVGLLLCVYLLWPAVHAVHLEGFTAQTQSLAMMRSFAPGVEHDPYLPLVSQFIYQTRSAVVEGLALIYQFFPRAGDLAFQAMVLTSFIVLMAASIAFATQWARLPVVFALFALVLTQGIPETAFFFNDNIVSAALACGALVLVGARSGMPGWILSGVLFGLAILSRVDAIFMGPILGGVMLYGIRGNRRRIAACLSVFLATATLLAASAIYHGFSLVDVFFVAKKFVVVIPEDRRFAVQAWVRMFFIGLSCLPFLIVGLAINLRRFKAERSYIGAITFVVYPVLLFLFAPKATEVRYIFPLLSPMIALHVGTGLLWAYHTLSKGRAGDREGKRQSRSAAVFAAFAVAVAVFPPTQVVVSDGPRVFLGRLWSPMLWKRWQDAVEASVARSRQLVAALDNQQKNVLISTHFNDEFFMRLRLIEAGFVPSSAARDFPACRGFSLFTKNGSVVAHVRTDPQYTIAPITIRYNGALQISSALDCPALASFDKTYISTFGTNKYFMSPEVYGALQRSFAGPLNVAFPDLRNRLQPDNPSLVREFGVLDFRPLSVQEKTALLSDAGKFAALFPERDLRNSEIVTIDAYEKYYRPQQGPTSAVLAAIKKDLTSSKDKLVRDQQR